MREVVYNYNRMKPIKQSDCLIRPEAVNIHLMRPLHLIS